MGSPEEIKDNAKQLYDSIKQYVFGRTGIWSMIIGLGTLLGINYQDVHNYAKAAAQVPKMKQEMDSLKIEMATMRIILSKKSNVDSAAFNKDIIRFRRFMDTVPSLFIKANFMEKAFVNVQDNQKEIQRKVERVEDKVDDVEDDVYRIRRSRNMPERSF